MIEELIHFPHAASALGLRDTRAVSALCQRYGIPVVKLNKRQRALRVSHYRLLLDLASGFVEAA